MLRSEAIALIQEGLGFTTQRESSIILRLKQAQRLLEQGRSLPWFLLQSNIVISAVAGTQAYAVAAGFLREGDDHSSFGINYFDSDGATVEVEKLQEREFYQLYPDATQGTPKAYCIITDAGTRYFALGPVPDGDITTFYYDAYIADTALDSDIENKWLQYAPDVLIGAAGVLMAQDLANDRAEAKFQKLYSSAWAGMFAEKIEMEDQRDPIRIGGRL